MSRLYASTYLVHARGNFFIITKQSVIMSHDIPITKIKLMQIDQIKLMKKLVESVGLEKEVLKITPFIWIGKGKLKREIISRLQKPK